MYFARLVRASFWLGFMETDTLIQLGMLVVTLIGVAVAIFEVRRSQSRQAEDRAQYYGRMTAVMEGLAEGHKRHDRS